MQNNIHFNCPNCNSNTYFGKTTMGKKYKDGPYQHVISEIQCSICFMDIPSNLCENISYDELDNKKKIWNDIYKPYHKLDAAKCSKCFRFYWEIEKYLFQNKISTKDIFYQNYNPKSGTGDLVCKICDPKSFK